MADRIILNTSIMKKSEKIKGKQAVALQKKKQFRYGLLAGAGVVIVAIIVLVFFNPFVVKAGDTVKVFYTGTLDDGTIFDSNVNGTPLTFTVGKGMVIPGFEEAVIGMAANSEKTVKISPEKAYGLYNTSLIHVVNRSAFPSNLTPAVGQYYSVQSTIDGSESSVKVINVTGFFDYSGCEPRAGGTKPDILDQAGGNKSEINNFFWFWERQGTKI